MMGPNTILNTAVPLKRPAPSRGPTAILQMKLIDVTFTIPALLSHSSFWNVGASNYLRTNLNYVMRTYGDSSFRWIWPAPFPRPWTLATSMVNNHRRCIRPASQVPRHPFVFRMSCHRRLSGVLLPWVHFRQQIQCDCLTTPLFSILLLFILCDHSFILGTFPPACPFEFSIFPQCPPWNVTQPWWLYPGPSLRLDHRHRLWHLRFKILINNTASTYAAPMGDYLSVPFAPSQERRAYTSHSPEMAHSFTSQERTVHTIHFKIWNPDSPHRSLFIQEINQQGYIKQAHRGPDTCQSTGWLVASILWHSNSPSKITFRGWCSSTCST